MIYANNTVIVNDYILKDNTTLLDEQSLIVKSNNFIDINIRVNKPAGNFSALLELPYSVTKTQRLNVMALGSNTDYFVLCQITSLLLRIHKEVMLVQQWITL